MDPGHCVDKTPDTEKRKGKEAAGEYNVPDPVVATYLLEEVGRDITRDAGGERIEQDGSGVHGVVSVHVEHAQQCHDNDRHRESQKLTPIT